MSRELFSVLFPDAVSYTKIFFFNFNLSRITDPSSMTLNNFTLFLYPFIHLFLVKWSGWFKFK